MIVAGKIRGNAPQLGTYFFTPGKNERITILHLDGREDATQEEFKDFLYSVELNSELTRSRNSAYHAYINPNPEDTTDRVMTKAEWLQSVEILTKELNYEDQRHGAVLHDLGNGRVHAHIVYERYNHERGTMVTYEHNYKAHDSARAEMEKQLRHKPTPQKNRNREGHKQALTAIWQQTATAQEFIREAQAGGYKIARGTDRPYKVIDAEGISFDLVRKLDGVKTSEVKERFGDLSLPPEKAAIKEMQVAKQQQTRSVIKAVEQRQPEATQDKPLEAEAVAGSSAKTPALDTTAHDQARQQFLQNVKDVRERNRSLTREITLSVLIALRLCFSFKSNAADMRSQLKQQFAACNNSIIEQQITKPPDRNLGFTETAQFYKPT